jgi:tetratricopeptide (TPR) repeat protein
MAGDAQAEIAELEAVHESATARGDFRLAAEAAVEIVHAGLSHGGAPEEVQRWAEHAKVAVARAGDLPRTQAQLESALAKLDWNEGRLTSARERLERAVDHWQVVVPEGSVNSSFAMTGLGLVLSDLGEAELARDTQVEAVRMLDAASPPGLWHVYAQNNLSLADAHAGESDEAAAVARDALALAMDDLGPSHFATFLVLGNLGDALRRGGRCDDALVVLEGPLRTELPDELREHPIVAGALQVQAGCLLDLGRPAEALPLLERSAEIFASVDEPLRLAENHMVLSRALWDSGRDPARAVALAEEARAAFAGVSEHRLAWAESWLEQRPPGDPPLR